MANPVRRPTEYSDERNQPGGPDPRDAKPRDVGPQDPGPQIDPLNPASMAGRPYEPAKTQFEPRPPPRGGMGMTPVLIVLTLVLVALTFFLLSGPAPNAPPPPAQSEPATPAPAAPAN